MERINWNKIDIITYSGEFMDAECKAESDKAFDLLRYYEYAGDKKRAAYIRRRLREKQNYIMN